MSIRIKTLLFTLASFSVVMGSLGYLFFLSLNERFGVIERRATLTNVDRAQSAITDRLRELSEKLGDWSNWDDSYQFIKDRNKQFIASNISYNALATLNIDFMLFMNLSGKVVYGVAIDRDSESVSHDLSSLESALNAHPTILSFPEENQEPRAGILRLSEGEYVLVSVRPILTSEFTGPSRGVIAFARRVNSRLTEYLRNTTHLNMSLEPLHISNTEIVPGATAPQVTAISEDIVRGELILADYGGAPVLRLTIDDSRTLMAEGWAAQRYVIWALILGGAGLAILLLVFFEHAVFRRLSRFQSQIQDVKREQDLSLRIDTVGNDEIAVLARNANEMLVDLQKAMEESKKLKVIAENANAAKSQFLANMSHEVRTPLHGILGLSEVLLSAALSTNESRSLRLINRSAQALLAVVNDILDFSKIEAGRIEISPVPFNLLQEVQDSIETVSAAAGARRITTLLEVKRPPLRQVVGDPLRIRQVLNNLLSNSLKFTPDGGGVWVILDCEEIGNMTHLSISVCDSGKGIQVNKVSEMFEPFRQEDASTSRQFGGTGLGLTICRQLVHTMGGSIEIKSRPSIGTSVTFRLALPIVSNESSTAEGKIVAEPEDTKRGTVTVSAPVLIAEDNEVNQRLLCAMLEKRRIEFVVAHNGAEAVEQFKNGTFSMILMDCQMPILDGYAASQEIRRFESETARVHRVPIVALTAHALPGDRDKCLLAGMDEYLSKPFRGSQLDALLRRFLAETSESSGVDRSPDSVSE